MGGDADRRGQSRIGPGAARAVQGRTAVGRVSIPAAATDNGLTVRDIFGGAAYYAVLAVRESHIVHSELRQVPPDKAGDLAQAIEGLADCQVALARRMDEDTRRMLSQAGIRPVATPVELVEDAVERFVLDALAQMGR